MQKDCDPRADLRLWELAAMGPGTGKALSRVLYNTGRDLGLNSVVGESQLSCGREGGRSHLPLPSPDLLTWQILEGAGDEGAAGSAPLSGPQELLLTRRIRVTLEKNHGLSLLAPLSL